MTTRRQVLLAGALGTLGIGRVKAQPRQPRIGVLGGRPMAESIYARPVVRRLGELGYKNIEYRNDQGDVERARKHARELVAMKCDLVFALGHHLYVDALKETGTRIPVVFLAGDYDPVEQGLLRNLARPEGNMTGVYSPQGLLVAKRVEILREVVPAARGFLILTDIWSKNHLGAAQRVAKASHLELTVVEFSQQPYDLAAGFETGRTAGVGGIVFMNSPVFVERAGELVKLAEAHRLPSIGSLGYPGALIRYYADVQKAGSRAAEMGVKILQGARPADIPVEQIDQVVMLLNGKLAQTLGVKIPESVRVRATPIAQ